MGTEGDGQGYPARMGGRLAGDPGLAGGCHTGIGLDRRGGGGVGACQAAHMRAKDITQTLGLAPQANPGDWVAWCACTAL